MSTGAMRLREVLKAILKGTKNALRQAEPESSPQLLPHCPQSRNSLLLPQEIEGEAEELLLRAVSAPTESCEVLERVSCAVEAVSQQASPLQIVALSSELQELLERIKSQQQTRLEELEELQYTIDSQVGVADHLIRRLSGLESEFQHIARVRRKAKPEVVGESAMESAHVVDEVVAAVQELLEKQTHRNERHRTSASSTATADLVDSNHARRGPPALSFDHDEGGAELNESAWSDVTSDSCRSDNNSAKRSGWPFLKGAKTPKQANQNSQAFTLKLIPVTPGRKSITLAVGNEELLRATVEEVAEAEASTTSPVPPKIDEDTAAPSLDSVTESELQSSDPQAPGLLPVDIACAAEHSVADLAAFFRSEVQADAGLDQPEFRPRTGYTTPCSDVPLSRDPSFGSLCDEPSPGTPRKLMQDEQLRVYLKERALDEAHKAGPAASTSAHQRCTDHQQWSTARLVPIAHKDRLEELLALELMPAAPRWCRAKQPSATTHTQSQQRCLHGRAPASRWEPSSQVSSCSSLALPNIDLATAGRTRALSTARGTGLHWVTDHCLSIEDVLEDRRVLQEMRQEAAAETNDMWARGPCTNGVTLSTSRWHVNDGVHVLVQSSPRQSPRQSTCYATPQQRVSLPSISPRASLCSNPGCGRESLLMAEAAALPAARHRRNSLEWSMRLDGV